MCALLQHGALQLLMIWSFFINCTFKLSSRFQDTSRKSSNSVLHYCLQYYQLWKGRRWGGGGLTLAQDHKKMRNNVRKRGEIKGKEGVKLRYREQEKAMRAASCRARGWSPAAPLISSPSPRPAPTFSASPCSQREWALTKTSADTR